MSDTKATKAAKAKKAKQDIVGQSFTGMTVQVNAENLPVLNNEIDRQNLADGLDSLPEEMQQKAREVSLLVNLRDSTSIASFAAGPQREMSSHLDGLLQNVQAVDIGQAGALVTELATGLKGLDFDVMHDEASGNWKGRIRAQLRKVPVVGRYVSHLERLHVAGREITAHMETVEQKAAAYMTQLRNGANSMDKLLTLTEQNLRQMAVWIKGGEMALRRMREEFEVERTAVLESRDVVRLTVLKDMAEQINAFETRILRLHLAFTTGIQNLPKIRQSQVASNIEFQNTLDTVLTDIPEIKSALVRLITMKNISAASEATAARQRVARDLGRLADDAGARAFLQAKASQGDFAKDLVYLGERAKKQSLITAKGVEMDREARENRRKAMEQIVDIRNTFVEEQSGSALISFQEK